MNQLEYFLASTDGSRADVMRYMQQLRDLDEWVEYHLAALRAITATRVLYLTNAAKAESSRHRGRGGRGAGSGRGRGRGRGGGAAAANASVLHAASSVGASSRHVYDVDAAEMGRSGMDDDEAAEASPAMEAAAYMAELQREFTWHETCVRQHCQEREMLAAELAERCVEVRLSMASRLANFASVADVPVTELSS